MNIRQRFKTWLMLKWRLWRLKRRGFGESPMAHLCEVQMMFHEFHDAQMKHMHDTSITDADHEISKAIADGWNPFSEHQQTHFLGVKLPPDTDEWSEVIEDAE